MSRPSAQTPLWTVPPRVRVIARISPELLDAAAKLFGGEVWPALLLVLDRLVQLAAMLEVLAACSATCRYPNTVLTLGRVGLGVEVQDDGAPGEVRQRGVLAVLVREREVGCLRSGCDHRSECTVSVAAALRRRPDRAALRTATTRRPASPTAHRSTRGCSRRPTPRHAAWTRRCRPRPDRSSRSFRPRRCGRRCS